MHFNVYYKNPRDFFFLVLYLGTKSLEFEEL